MSFRSLFLLLALALLVSCARPVPDASVTAEAPDLSATVEATETEALIEAARSAFQGAQPTRGGAFLQAYIERQEDDDATLRAYMTAEEFEERDLAIALLESAWRAWPSQTIASHLGELYWRSGRLQEVGALFSELLEHSEDVDTTRRFAIHFASRRGLRDLAEDLAMQAFAPDDSRRLLNQAQIRNRAGDTAGAHRSLEAYLDEADEILPVLELSILVTLERWEEAEKLARDILASPERRYQVDWRQRLDQEHHWTTPENPQPQLLTLARILEAQGRHDEAFRLFEGLESLGYWTGRPGGRDSGIDTFGLYRMLFDEGRHELAFHIANDTGEASPASVRPILVHLHTQGRHEEFDALLDRVFVGTGRPVRHWNPSHVIRDPGEADLAIVLGIYDRTQDPSLHVLLARFLVIDSPLATEAAQILQEELSPADRIALAAQFRDRPATALKLIEGLSPDGHPEVLQVLQSLFRSGPHTGFHHRASELTEVMEPVDTEPDHRRLVESRRFREAEPLLLEQRDDLDDPELLTRAIRGLLQLSRERTALELTEALLRHGEPREQDFAFRTRMSVMRLGGHDLDAHQEVERFLSVARDPDWATIVAIEELLAMGHDQAVAPLLDELLERDLVSTLDLLFGSGREGWKDLDQDQIGLLMEAIAEELGYGDRVHYLALPKVGPFLSDENFEWFWNEMERAGTVSASGLIRFAGTLLDRYDEEGAWRQAWRARRLLEGYNRDDFARTGRSLEDSANMARTFEYYANGIADIRVIDEFPYLPVVHRFLADPDPEMVAIGEGYMHYLRVNLLMDPALQRQTILEAMRPDLLLGLSDHQLDNPNIVAEIAPDLARVIEVSQVLEPAPGHTRESIERSARRAQLDGDRARHENLLAELSGEVHLAPIVVPALIRWHGSLDAAASVLAAVAELPAQAVFLQAPADAVPTGDGIREETYVRAAYALIEIDRPQEALAILDAQAEALRYRPDDITILRWLAGESELFEVDGIHSVYGPTVAGFLVEQGRWEEAVAFDPRLERLLLGRRIMEDPRGVRQVVEEHLASVPDPGRGTGRVLDTLSRLGHRSLANEIARSVLEQDRSGGAIRRLIPHLIAAAEPADAGSLAEFAINIDGRFFNPLKGGEYRVLRRYLPAAEPDLLLTILDEADHYDRTWNRILRAQLHFRAGQVDSGREEILEVLEGMGPNFLNVTVLVDELLADGLFLEVARTIAPAVPDEEVNARLAAAFAFSEFMLGQHDAAEGWLNRVDEAATQPQFWRMDIADRLVRHGEFQSIPRALGDAPDVPHVRYLRALVVLARGGAEAPEAVSAISQAADQGVHLVASHHNALLAAAAGECTDCLDGILASLAERAGPDDWDGLEQVARLHGSLKGNPTEPDSLDAAIQEARTALLVATTPAPTDFQRLGHLLHRSGELAAAETALRSGLRAWAEGRDHPASDLRLLSSTLAEVLTDQGEHDRALGWHTAAQRLPVSPY